MSQPWRGGTHGKKRPYSKGPRGGFNNSNVRYTRWDKEKQPQDEQRYINGPPVYMNADRTSFWQDCFNEFQPQQRPTQQFHFNSNYGPNPWIFAYKNYRYPPPLNRQHSNGQSPENSKKITLTGNCNKEANGIEGTPPSTSSRSRQDSETSQSKASEEPVVAHPGSEAAREKERAEIAARLKQLDTNQLINNSKDSKEKDNQTKTISSNKDINQKKRNFPLSKSDEKDPKRSKKSCEKVTSSSDKSKYLNSKKEKTNSQNKTKESPSEKKVNAVASSKTSSTKVSASVQKRKDKQPTSKKSSIENQSSSRKNNQIPSTSSTSKVTPSEKENKVLSRLYSMGKEDLISWLNNPQLPKAQEMLKVLMKCYHETKALELDKRRFTISTTPEQSSISGNVESNLSNFLDLPSIAMSDLPSDLVNQIENFLGCDISLQTDMANQTQDQILNNNIFSSPQTSTEFQIPTSSNNLLTHLMPPQNFQGTWTNLPIVPLNEESFSSFEQNNEFQRIYLNRQPGINYGEHEQTQTPGDNISESSTEKAPSPYQSYLDDNGQNLFTQNFNQNFNLPPYYNPLPQLNQYDDQTPFKILNELSIIDLRIQTDIHRKMQLYKELHMYLQNSSRKEPPQLIEPVEPFLPPSNPMCHNQSASNSNPERFNSPHVLQNESNTVVIPPSNNLLQSTSKQCDAPPLSQIPLQQNSVPSQTKQTIDLTLDEDDQSKVIASSSSSSFQSVQKSIKKLGCIGCKPLVLTPEKTVMKLSSKTKVNDMKVVNNTTVVVACEDCIIYAYDLKTGRETHQFRGHTSAVTVVQPTKKKNEEKEVTGEFILCSGSLDEMLCFFDSESQECITKRYLASGITCLEFSPPNMLYVGVHCGQVFTCNVDTKELINNPMDCGSNSILSILAIKEGPRNVLIISSVGRTIVMKDAQNGLLLRSFAMSWQQKTFGLAVFGNQLFCGAMKKSISYYNLTTGELEGELNVSSNVAFITLYKHLLFVACWVGQIFVFDLKKKEKLMEFPGAKSNLRSVQIKNNRIISCGRQNKMEAICFPPELIRNIRSSCTCKPSEKKLS